MWIKLKFLMVATMIVVGCSNDLSVFAYDGEQVVSLNDITQDQESRGYYDGRPFTGTAVTLHRNSNLNNRIQFYYGELHGQAESWHSNQVLASLVEYTNHQKDGLAIRWNDQGVVETVIHYENDLQQGLTIYFDNLGEVDQYSCFDEDEEVNQTYCIDNYMTHFVDYLNYLPSETNLFEPEFN